MANAIIRQEINISNQQISANNNTSSETVQLDTTQYNGATYYFEIVAFSTLSVTDTVTLRRKGTSTDDATCTIPLGTTSATRIRSSSFSPPAGQTEYNFYIGTSTTNITIKAARIIIIQSAATLTNTETQIEIGNDQNIVAGTQTQATPFPNTKYWLYTAANWDGTKTFYAEVTYVMSTSKVTGTVTLQEDNGSFASWADIVTVVNAGTATSATRVRSTSFAPTDGRHYRMAYKNSSSKSIFYAYNAKVIVDQTASPTKVEPQYLLLNTFNNGTGLQTFQTLWDSTEWNDTQGGLPTFKYSHDATNASDSSKLVDITASADVTGATVTGANQQISSAFTMPTTGHQVDTNVTTATGVIGASRILVVYTVVYTTVAATSRTMRLFEGYRIKFLNGRIILNKKH